MSAPTDVEVVLELRGGLSLTLATQRLLCDLEARGFQVIADERGLHVKPTSRLTPEDDAAIRAHRHSLVALVRYCERVTWPWDVVSGARTGGRCDCWV
jgi:hypothetical protein